MYIDDFNFDSQRHNNNNAFEHICFKIRASQQLLKW